MTDPNAVYKAGFLALTEKLGRVPTSKDQEWLELGNGYSAAYSEARDARIIQERAAAGRPEQVSPSRQPAPQARAMDSVAREAVPDLMAALEASLADARERRLSRSRLIPEAEEAVSAPAAPIAPSRVYDGLIEGDRGPRGGLVGKCEDCGRLWERPARRGRPSYKCEECR